MQSELTVDSLAQEIRRVDGNHSLGAGALAEALIPFLTAALSDKQAGEVSCIACEGRPSAGNNPCAVCGRSALVDVPAVEPVAWLDDGSCRAGSDRTAHRVVTNDQKSGMPAATASSFTVPLYTSPPLSREGEDSAEVERKFKLGDRVTKTKGSSWQGHVVGFYSTALTPVGYAVESEREPGSVQIYPESALAATRSGSATSSSGGDR